MNSESGNGNHGDAPVSVKRPTVDEWSKLFERMTGTRARNHLDAVVGELVSMRAPSAKPPRWARRVSDEELEAEMTRRRGLL